MIVSVTTAARATRCARGSNERPLEGHMAPVRIKGAIASTPLMHPSTPGLRTLTKVAEQKS